jgi:hypothetical protein
MEKALQRPEPPADRIRSSYRPNISTGAIERKGGAVPGRPSTVGGTGHGGIDAPMDVTTPYEDAFPFLLAVITAE